MTAAQAHAGANVLGAGYLLLQYERRFVDHRHQNEVNHETGTVTSVNGGLADALGGGLGLVLVCKPRISSTSYIIGTRLNR